METNFTANDLNDLTSNDMEGYDKVKKWIFERHQLGFKYVTYGGKLGSGTCAKLKSEGFRVKYVSDQRDGNFYKITW